MAATQFVKDAIAHDPIVLFTKSDCGYCEMVKEIFDNMKVTYKVIELDNREDMDDIQDALEGITGARSVPRVFVDGVFIGGGSDVRKMSQSGKLQELLQK
ncbi:glutaredoxin-2, mitochondrial-like [Sipha flava]|uniref:Glutaredoxin-2, mitochondrial n=1 Tax=Sipha flava TaxID=143950 RepID=A0A2S2Q7G5_9HEMI|nr:glutaredoxin-2, mitochondrial-like [Sipha flava]XP_025423276.1 glutaredoxin-2, mitochondrial-like [Sipha flava]